MGRDSRGADIHIDATSRAIVQAVKTVALTLGKEVIAEGVECEEHAVVLREIGVEHGQGYLWGRPSGKLDRHGDGGIRGPQRQRCPWTGGWHVGHR